MKVCMGKLSQSLEDYLKAIILLGGTTGQSVRPSDIARHMNVSKTSVGKALTALRKYDFVIQPYYGEVTLTEAGYAYGTSILKRYDYLEAFLEKAIGLEQGTAEKEACLMEHGISDESFEKWADYIERLGIVERVGG